MILTEAKSDSINWVFVLQTKRKLKSNKTDIAVKDYKKKKTYLGIDMPVPTEIEKK